VVIHQEAETVVDIHQEVETQEEETEVTQEDTNLHYIFSKNINEKRDKIAFFVYYICI